MFPLFHSDIKIKDRSACRATSRSLKVSVWRTDREGIYFEEGLLKMESSV